MPGPSCARVGSLHPSPTMPVPDHRPSEAHKCARNFVKDMMESATWQAAKDPTVRRGAPLDFFPEVVRQGITEEIADELTQVSCLGFMDSLWFCYASPFHQLPHFYKHGGADTCVKQFNECTACFAIKSKATTEIKRYLEERFPIELPTGNKAFKLKR